MGPKNPLGQTQVNDAYISDGAQERECMLLVDGLGGKYAKMAEDQRLSAKLRQAAQLFADAEGHLVGEREKEAIEVASQALEAFRALSDQTGAADSLRVLIAITAWQGRIKDAAEKARGEMERFRSAGFPEGVAKMQLAFAEVGGDLQGQKYREDALQLALDAREFFRESKDKAMEANTLLALSAVHRQRKGDAEAEKKKARELAQESRDIFRELGDRKREAAALHLLGVTHMQSREFVVGSFEAALEVVRESCSIFRDLTIKKMQSVELQTLARFFTLENRLDEALPHAQQALELLWESKLPNGFALAAMRTLFDVYAAKSDADLALSVAQDGLRRFEKAGDRRGQAGSWGMLSQAHCLRHDLQLGLDAAEQSMVLFRDLAEHTWEVKMIQRMAGICLGMERLDEAMAKASEAIDRFDAMKDSANKAVAMHTLAEIHNSVGDGEQALKIGMDERDTFQKAGDASGEASSFFTMCFAHIRKGDVEQAIAASHEAARIFRSAADKKGELLALRLYGELLMAQQQWEDALREMENSMTLVTETKDKGAEAGVTLLMAQCLAMIIGRGGPEDLEPKEQPNFRKQFDPCLGMALKAVDLARKSGEEKHLAASLCTLAQVYMLDKQLEKTLEHAKEAMSVSIDIGHDSGEAYAMVIMAEARGRSGKLDQARDVCKTGLKIFQRIDDKLGIRHASEMLEKIEVALPKVKVKAPEQPAAGPGPKTQEALAPVQEQQVVQSGGGPTRSRDEHDSITSTLLRVTAEIIGLDEDLQVDVPLMSSGLTSNAAVLLRNKLAEEMPGVSLGFTLVFDYPTISAIASHIAESAAG